MEEKKSPIPSHIGFAHFSAGSRTPMNPPIETSTPIGFDRILNKMEKDYVDEIENIDEELDKRYSHLFEKISVYEQIKASRKISSVTMNSSIRNPENHFQSVNTDLNENHYDLTNKDVISMNRSSIETIVDQDDAKLEEESDTKHEVGLLCKQEKSNIIHFTNRKYDPDIDPEITSQISDVPLNKEMSKTRIIRMAKEFLFGMAVVALVGTITMYIGSMVKAILAF